VAARAESWWRELTAQGLRNRCADFPELKTRELAFGGTMRWGALLAAIARLTAILVMVTTAILVMVTDVWAQAQDPILPKISVAKALYFRNNPEAWSQFLAGLPRRPSGQLQPTSPMAPPPPFGGTWTAVTPAPEAGLCNPLLLTDGTVIAHVCATGTWYKLTPTNTGDYAGGTWTQIATMPSGYEPT
jgi:hypothetical protein